MDEERMCQEIAAAGRAVGLPPEQVGRYCQSMRDGDCRWEHCPQERDGEPARSGRHCPLDLHEEERGYQ
jgi:hypothetical protein